MARLLYTILALLLPAVTLHAAERLTRYNLDFSLSKAHFVDTIGIEWKQERIFLNVMVGHRKMRFMLDTGAGQAVVFADHPLEGSEAAGHIISHDATGHTDTVPVLRLPPLTLGTLTLTGMQATQQQRAAGRYDFDGILGFDLVCKGLSAKIDVARKQLILTDLKDFFDQEPAYTMRYRLRLHTPYVEVCPFGRFREEALFDTGSSRFFALNKGSLDRAALKSGPLPERLVEGRSEGRLAMGHQGAEQRNEVAFLNIERLRMGGVTFCDIHTVTTQGGSHLGASLLNYGAMTFNPRRRRMGFQPYAGEPVVTIGNKQTDIAFVSEGGMPVVSLVWEQGTPYKQGFREGDTIISIDGKPVLSFAQFAKWGFEAGREYRFTVRNREGQLHDRYWVRQPR